jgi:hypothetical protein
MKIFKYIIYSLLGLFLLFSCEEKVEDLSDELTTIQSQIDSTLSASDSLNKVLDSLSVEVKKEYTNQTIIKHLNHLYQDNSNEIKWTHEYTDGRISKSYLRKYNFIDFNYIDKHPQQQFDKTKLNYQLNIEDKSVMKPSNPPEFTTTSNLNLATYVHTYSDNSLISSKSTTDNIKWFWNSTKIDSLTIDKSFSEKIVIKFKNGAPESRIRYNKNNRIISSTIYTTNTEGLITEEKTLTPNIENLGDYNNGVLTKKYTYDNNNLTKYEFREELKFPETKIKLLVIDMSYDSKNRIVSRSEYTKLTTYDNSEKKVLVEYEYPEDSAFKKITTNYKQDDINVIKNKSFVTVNNDALVKEYIILNYYNEENYDKRHVAFEYSDKTLTKKTEFEYDSDNPEEITYKETSEFNSQSLLTHHYNEDKGDDGFELIYDTHISYNNQNLVSFYSRNVEGNKFYSYNLEYNNDSISKITYISKNLNSEDSSRIKEIINVHELLSNEKITIDEDGDYDYNLDDLYKVTIEKYSSTNNSEYTLINKVEFEGISIDNNTKAKKVSYYVNNKISQINEYTHNTNGAVTSKKVSIYDESETLTSEKTYTANGYVYYDDDKFDYSGWSGNWIEN